MNGFERNYSDIEQEKLLKEIKDLLEKHYNLPKGTKIKCFTIECKDGDKLTVNVELQKEKIEEINE